jgi:type I restriction enzyme S subunit
MLGKYIQPVDVRNDARKEENLLGVTTQKYFMPSIANTVGTDFSKYKIVRRGQFTYVPDTSRRGDRIAIALLRDWDEGLVSNIYTVFEVTDTDKLLPEYLMLWFKRPEFDRYARFKSHGSVREIFDWDEMCKVALPVPDIAVQRSIVRAYNTIEGRIKHLRQVNDNLEAQIKAFYYELTSNIEETVPFGWRQGKLKDFTTTQYGFTASATIEQVGPRFLRITDIAQSFIDWSTVPYCLISKQNLNKYRLQAGDVVVARTGATVGASQYIGERAPLAVFASYLIRITPTVNEQKYYLGQLITSKEYKQFVHMNAGGSAQPQANAQLLGEFDIIVPAIEAITQFNRQIKPLLDLVELNQLEMAELRGLQDTAVSLILTR